MQEVWTKEEKRHLRVLRMMGLGALAASAIVGCATAASFDPAGLLSDGDAQTPPAQDGSSGGLDDGSLTTSDGSDDGLTDPDTAPPPRDAGKDASDAKPQDAQPDAPAPVKPAVGEVIISEVMYDPSGTEPDQEWIELYNTTSSPRLLSGLTLKDESARTHTIASAPQVVIAGGAYAVLARSKTAATGAQVPAAAILYEYGTGQTSSTGIILTNSSSGAIELDDGATQITQSPYGPWFNQSGSGGQSIQLKGTTGAMSGVMAGWCLSSNTWAAGADRGTPGAASDCP